MKPNSTSSRLVFSILLGAGLCISPMRAQAQIDPGNAPEDQSAAAQKAKAQEQKSKLGSKGSEKRIINNGKVEKGLGGPDTKTKGAEAFKKAGKGDKALGGPDTKTKDSSEKPTTKATVKGFNPQPDPPGGPVKPGQNRGDSSYGTGVYKKGGEKAQEPYLKKGGPTSPGTIKGFNPQPDPPGKATTKQPGGPGSDSAIQDSKKKLSPEEIKKAEGGIPDEGSDEGTITPGSKTTGKAAADSAKSKLKKKGFSPEDKKKLANALGDLDEDGGGRTITPGTPDREPPNLLKKKDANAVSSDGSGGTISPGTSATPRPKLQEKP